MSRQRSPDPIRRHLSPLLRSIERTYPDRGHRVWEVWTGTVGADLAARCSPLEFRKGHLTLAVCSSTWMQQIQFLLPKIRDSLNAALGEELVRDIRLRVRETPQPEPEESRPADPQPEWLHVRLPAAALQQIEADLSDIGDPDLRAALRRVRIRAEQVRRFRERREG